jgi:aldehyde:ferredoxin oxidoreductase
MVLGGGDVRGAKGTALTFATATRGGDHLRGVNLLELPFIGKTLISPEEAIKRFGTADVLEHQSYNKAPTVVYFQDVYTLADALQICKFNTARNGHGVTIQDMADMYSAATGVAADEKSMRTAADRIYAVERCFSIREGIRKKDDFLQGKWVAGPIPGGPLEGSSIDREKFEKMLEDYYLMRGWDKETGIPTQERLQALEVSEVAQDMEQYVTA